jgi:hypothetical protein
MTPDDETQFTALSMKAARLRILWSAVTKVRQWISAESASIPARAKAWVAAQQPRETIRRAGQKSVTYLRTTSWQALPLQHKALVVGLGALLLLLIIWKVPQWQAARWEGRIELKEVAKQESDTRTTVVQAIGGAVLLVGLWLTWRNIRLTEKNIQITQETALRNFETAREGQITDRFTKAIVQLGEAGPNKLAIRLGGVYGLERIAKDSERDHWPIMEILTTYVREHAPSEVDHSSTAKAPQYAPKMAPDIQAILTVIGRRTRLFGKGEDQRLNLSYTDLRNAHLELAHLEGANFTEAHLEGAHMSIAHLNGARFVEAYLEEADLWGAHLDGVHFWNTHLKGVDLGGAFLEGADLMGADLEKADLRRVIGLTVEQLADAKTLYQAKLDSPLLEAVMQKYQHLREPPQV